MMENDGNWQLIFDLKKELSKARSSNNGLNYPEEYRCTCKKVAVGSYDNQIWVHAPSHMPRDRGYAIDSCLFDEIMSLWKEGIATTGCCCGHNSPSFSYIGVIDSDIQRMKELGYRVHVNDGREDSFIPKFKALKDNHA